MQVKSITITTRLGLLLGLFALVGAPVQAAGSFDSTTSLTISIDNILNLSNPGDLSGLDISGSFFLDGVSSGETLTGDGSVTPNYNGGSLPVPAGIGDSFTQTFGLTGTATIGSVDAFYQGFGDLLMQNLSADSYQIDFSLTYDLDTSGSGGDLSEATASLDYYDDNGAVNAGFVEASASNFGPTSDNVNNLLSPDSFSLTLNAFENNTFYADVAISGFTQATVPIPGAAWLFLSGIAALIRRRATTS